MFSPRLRHYLHGRIQASFYQHSSIGTGMPPLLSPLGVLDMTSLEITNLAFTTMVSSRHRTHHCDQRHLWSLLWEQSRVGTEKSGGEAGVEGGCVVQLLDLLWGERDLERFGIRSKLLERGSTDDWVNGRVLGSHPGHGD